MPNGVTFDSLAAEYFLHRCHVLRSFLLPATGKLMQSRLFKTTLVGIPEERFSNFNPPMSVLFFHRGLLCIAPRF